MSGKYALIIGNNEYTDSGLAQLSAPGRDAEDFARVLNDKDIGAFDSVNVLVNQTSSSVLESIDEFFDQKKPDDMLVLYFSGHGIKDEIGSLYLAFKNTIRSRLRATAIKSDYIREAMDQSRSKRQVLILDCCNSGAFPQGTKAELGGAMGMPQAFQGYGRFVLTASDATQFAWEGDKVIGETDNSLFTHFLVKGLEGEADNDGDGRITVDELYDYAYDQISRVTPKQTPTKSSSKVEGEIVLRQNMRIEDIKPIALPDDLISEIEDLRPLVREGAVQRLEKIIKGKNIGMARSALDALERIVSDENTTRRVAQLATQALEYYRQAEQRAEAERKAREEVERLVILKAEEERLAQEREKAERKAKEEAKRLAFAKAEQEAAEHEAAQKAEHEAMELDARKKTEREAAEKAEREAMELANRRRAEREAKAKVTVAPGKIDPQPTTQRQQPTLKWIIIGVIGLSILGTGAWGISYLVGLINPVPSQNETPTLLLPSPTPAVFDPDLVTPESVLPLPFWTSFNTPNPILSDGRVRRAIAYCTNRIELLESVYPLLTDAERQNLVAYSFVPRSHWAYPGDENLFIYPYDPEKGTSLLEEAGWSLPNGKTYRVSSNSDELALPFTTTTATFRKTWATVWEEQMKECGIRITRKHEEASWWFGNESGLARREFELGAFAWVGTSDPSGLTLYSCDEIPVPDNDWVGQNYMGWCNENASKYIKQANNTLIKAERIVAYFAFQREFTKDVPSIPLFNRIETFAYNAQLTGFAPTPGEPYYTYNVTEWEIPGRDTIVIGFTQEPASLFTLVEDSYVANLVETLIRPTQATSLNYDYQAVLVSQLPTVENGGTIINEVQVNAGDKVVNVNGDVVDLVSGVKIKNTNGEEIEYTGGSVTMTQLVSRFEIVDGLTWEDGTSISKADLELGYAISCNPYFGADFLCDRTASVEFFDTGYTQTWLPGYQNPLHFVPAWPIYPAHQLGSLPASKWATDPRVTETPLSYGPYRIVEWVKGKKITLARNLHWFGSAPNTPNLVIQIITPESAETQLISGEIDILDSTSIAGITETFAAARQKGLIKILINPSATWEHIDFNLFINP